MHVTLYEYSQLDLTDRCQLLWEQGTLLHNVATFTHGFNLYCLYGYYVEVVVKYEAEAVTITDAVPFVRGYRLSKYLASIDLVDMLND
jgi:hypothetical protein